MKLFNINLNINSTKNILKFLLLAFIVILCIYILYISSLSTIEGFTQSKDCSNCQIMPSSGNCIKLYEFSNDDNLDIYNDITSHFRIGNTKLPDLSFIDTSYIFCPYEQKCIGENIIDNRNASDEIIDITCCSGEWLNRQISNFQSNKFVNDLNEKCNNINNKINQYMDSIKGESTIFDTDILDIFPDSYFNVRSMCNNYKNNNMSGMLFKRDISNRDHILKDPKLLPKSNDPNDRTESVQELLDAQRMLSISMEEVSYNVVENGITQTRFETRSDPNTIRQIEDLNNDLKKLNTLGPDFNAKFIEKQNQLAELYKDSCGNYIEFIDYKYYPYKPNSNNDGLTQIRPPTSSILGEYVLLEDEFLNCFGEVNDNTDLSFNNDDYADMLSTTGRKNFFGVDENAEYSTQQDTTSLGYGPSMDLAAEFRHLESVNVGGTAPTGVIDQYLRAINGFYEKQMSNMLGPKTHAVNQQVVFENDGLATKESSFFVYDNEANNDYECQPSITGNDKFKNCGPSAYYSDFKP
jgi:hypothetical protein